MPLFLSLLAVASSGSPSASQVVPAETILQAVQSELSASSTEGNIKFHISGRVTEQSLPVGKVGVTLGSVNGTWPRARMGLPVRLSVDGRWVRSVTVWVEATDERKVATYSRAYSAHEPGDHIVLTPAIVDMTCCEGNVAVDGVIASQRLKHPVRVGQPALTSDFELAPDVAARQFVTARVLHGSVRVSIRAIALHDARIGDSIDVRPVGALDVVRAHVVSKQEVVVE